MSQLPVRPETPTLDALWTAHGIGASRYEIVRALNGGAGIRDNALPLYYSQKDWKNEPIDVSSVSTGDVSLAREYLNMVDAATRANGGDLPGEGKNETPIPHPVDGPYVDEPPSRPIAEPDAKPAAPPSVHTDHAESWLVKVGHAATPENIETVVTVLGALSKLFAKRK